MCATIDNDYCRTEIKRGRTGWQVAFYSREIGGRLGERWHVPYTDLGRVRKGPRWSQTETEITHDQAVDLIGQIRAGNIGRMLARGVVVS